MPSIPRTIVIKSKLEPEFLQKWTRFAATSARSVSWQDAKPFFSIPGPKPWGLFSKYGNMWRFTFGDFSNLTSDETNTKLVEEYGPISRLTGLGQKDIVFLSDSKDVEAVFRTETARPTRHTFPAFEHYRLNVRPDIFHGNPGLLATQGEQWYQNRALIKNILMKPPSARNYHHPIESVVDNFIPIIRQFRNEHMEMPKDFKNIISKYTLEANSKVFLDESSGIFEPHSEAQKMIDTAEVFFDLSSKILPIMWRLKTPRWREFVKCMDDFHKEVMKHINKKIVEIDTRSDKSHVGPSVLEAVYRQNGRQKAIVMMIDTMIAGIDNTTVALAAILYLLSKYPLAQEKVFQETLRVLPDKNSALSPDYLDQMPYFKAFIKECQRFLPVATNNFRTTGQNLVLQGYRVPKGTEVVLMNRHMCLSDDYFDRAKEFIVERWMLNRTAHSFANLPFGHGPRNCVGRRVAEMQTNILITKIIRNFEITYGYGEMNWDVGFTPKPKDPLKFKMKDRAD